MTEVAYPVLPSVDFEEGDGVLAVDLIAWWMKQHTLLLCSSARVNENSNEDKVPEMRTLWRLKVNSESAQARQNSHKYTIGTLVSTCVEQNESKCRKHTNTCACHTYFRVGGEVPRSHTIPSQLNHLQQQARVDAKVRESYVHEIHSSKRGI